MADVGILLLRPRTTLSRLFPATLARAENTRSGPRDSIPGNCLLEFGPRGQRRNQLRWQAGRFDSFSLLCDRAAHLISLDQGDARRAIVALDNRGISAGRDRSDDGRFAIITGRNSSCLDL